MATGVSFGSGKNDCPILGYNIGIIETSTAVVAERMLNLLLDHDFVAGVDIYSEAIPSTVIDSDVGSLSELKNNRE